MIIEAIRRFYNDEGKFKQFLGEFEKLLNDINSATEKNNFALSQKTTRHLYEYNRDRENEALPLLTKEETEEEVAFVKQQFLREKVIEFLQEKKVYNQIRNYSIEYFLTNEATYVDFTKDIQKNRGSELDRSPELESIPKTPLKKGILLVDHFLEVQKKNQFHEITHTNAFNFKDNKIKVNSDYAYLRDVKNGKYNDGITGPGRYTHRVYTPYKIDATLKSSDYGHGIQLARHLYTFLTGKVPEKLKITERDFDSVDLNNETEQDLKKLIIALDNQKSSKPIPLIQAKWELAKIAAKQEYQQNPTVQAIIDTVDKFNNDGKSFFDIGSKAKAERIMNALTDIPVEQWKDIDFTKQSNDPKIENLKQAIASHRHFWRSSPNNNSGVNEQKAAKSFRALKDRLSEIKKGSQNDEKKSEAEQGSIMTPGRGSK